MLSLILIDIKTHDYIYTIIRCIKFSLEAGHKKTPSICPYLGPSTKFVLFFFLTYWDPAQPWSQMEQDVFTYLANKIKNQTFKMNTFKIKGSICFLNITLRLEIKATAGEWNSY